MDVPAVADQAHADLAVVGAFEVDDAAGDQLVDLPGVGAEVAGEGFGGGVEG
ncbi:hypothetical protein [Streptomyces sp. NPDC047453]|uniref:hypothetical protein n=1 Tax=Streptomyces sp. NPDC047453 TaxID=3154812 RepID=UPI0033FC3123